MSVDTWAWFGRAGHLVVGDRCRFRLHTHVGGGRWCVSTVGAWHINEDDDAPHDIGLRRLYETMVFEIKANTLEWEPKDFDPYATDEEAAAGHMALCRKWDAL